MGTSEKLNEKAARQLVQRGKTGPDMQGRSGF